MSTRKRNKLAKGIYEDKFGVAIIISVHGTPKEFRAGHDGRPYSDHRNDTAWLRQERLDRQRAATVLQDRKEAEASTMTADVERFLDTLHGALHQKNMRSYMKHWTRVFGDRERNSITDLELKTAYATIGKAANSKRHYRHALIHFYETLNGKDGYNPARNLYAPPKPKTEARAWSYDLIEKIFKALPASKSKARLMVIAYTGLPHTLIKKLQPSDLRLAIAEVQVSPRRKGAGVVGRTIPLSAKGVAALREFQRLQAFGSFQNRQLANTLKYGAKLAKVTLPANARPYDLRHSFLTEVYRQTGDLKAVSELGMHATLEQTARYTQGATSERATKAITAVPRFATTKTVQTSPKTPKIVRGTVRSTRRGTRAK